MSILYGDRILVFFSQILRYYPFKKYICDNEQLLSYQVQLILIEFQLRIKRRLVIHEIITTSNLKVDNAYLFEKLDLL